MTVRPTDAPPSLLAGLARLWQTLCFATESGLPTRMRGVSLAMLIVVPAMLLYPVRGFHLLEPDEGRYAQIAKELYDNKEWVVPTLQGEAYLDKPPLMYWLVKLSYLLFGVSESAARLVPAMCVHLTILAVYGLGRRSVGERAAFWAAMLLSLSPGYVSVARLLLLDGLLTLCVSVSILCGFEAVRTGTFRRGWWLAAAVASGLGFLTKGPISEVLLFPPLFLFAWLSGSCAKVRKWDLLAFALIVLLVNLPWYVAIYQREPAFLKYFFWEHNVMRFLQPFDHLQPIWYYTPILLGGMLPSLGLVLLYGRDLIFRTAQTTKLRSHAGGFWLLAGGWCVLFFSISGSKLPTYILPAYPFLCLMLGDYLARSSWDTRRLPKMILGSAAVVLFGFHTWALPWYAEKRSPFADAELVSRYVNDPTVTVITYPRNCDSVAFYTNRSDFDRVRSKGVNQLIVDMHHRPKTVVLFTHNHSYESFCEALPESLSVTERVSLRRDSSHWLDRLVGTSPWGLLDIAVIVPTHHVSAVRAQTP